MAELVAPLGPIPAVQHEVPIHEFKVRLQFLPRLSKS
jgi:hypothetical protein